MNKLERYRLEIDAIDRQLLKLISERINVVKRVGEYKKKVGKPIRDPKREKALIDRLVEYSKDLQLPREVIEKIWKTFFKVAYIIEEIEGKK